MKPKNRNLQSLVFLAAMAATCATPVAKAFDPRKVEPIRILLTELDVERREWAMTTLEKFNEDKKGSFYPAFTERLPEIVESDVQLEWANYYSDRRLQGMRIKVAGKSGPEYQTWAAVSSQKGFIFRDLLRAEHGQRIGRSMENVDPRDFAATFMAGFRVVEALPTLIESYSQSEPALMGRSNFPMILSLLKYKNVESEWQAYGEKMGELRSKFIQSLVARFFRIAAESYGDENVLSEKLESALTDILIAEIHDLPDHAYPRDHMTVGIQVALRAGPRIIEQILLGPVLTDFQSRWLFAQTHAMLAKEETTAETNARLGRLEDPRRNPRRLEQALQRARADLMEWSKYQQEATSAQVGMSRLRKEQLRRICPGLVLTNARSGTVGSAGIE
ncbi:MAG: hypothetical protein K2X47_18870 [Bdellovibrionales bacterium]|nr:hypothetical protein [Bdellovibrionales bacterium]